MLLDKKTVVIVGAAGAIGEAVARRAAAEGAKLHLFGRTEEPLTRLARELGAQAHVGDATDENTVEAVFRRVVEADEQLDMTFNAVGPRAAECGYGLPAPALPVEQFLRTMLVVAGSQFLVARAAARHMTTRGRGVIVTLSASLSGQFVPLMTGITAACSAVEGLTRSLAAEVGPRGVRVVCVRAGGMPATRTIQETSAAIARSTGTPMDASSTSPNLLRRPLAPAEVAAAVTWLGSDAASGIDGQILNVCAGSIVSR
ncbi:MAG: SDR family oxidoreductase [Polyangiaceae bacterium]